MQEFILILTLIMQIGPFAVMEKHQDSYKFEQRIQLDKFESHEACDERRDDMEKNTTPIKNSFMLYSCVPVVQKAEVEKSEP